MPQDTLVQIQPHDASSNEGTAPILFLISSLGIAGSERKTVQVANELDRRGYNVHVAYLNPRAKLLGELNEGVSVVCLERKGKLSFSTVARLRAYIKEVGVSQIVCVNLYPLIYLQAACRLLSSKDVPRVILTINTTEHTSLKEKLAMILYRPLIVRVDQIIFGCRAQLDLWCQRYRLDKARCGVIYNGVDDVRFSPGVISANREFTIPGVAGDDTFLIGSVGGLRRVKNQRELVKLLASLEDTLPNARLVIVGDGIERASLEVTVREAGLAERVVFLGLVNDVRPILATIDVLIVPSISETFSNSALEGMAMGKTVVLSDTGGAREMVQEGIDGFVYQQGNIPYLTGLVRKLAMEPAVRSRIGSRARQTVLERFSFTRMVDDFDRLLQ